MIEFRAWPSIPRLHRDCTITEKIDGTNACVIVTDEGEVAAQSRKRLTTPEDDNAGFARWVHQHEGALRTALGPGHHYGEWYGQGIQRRYGLTEKRFALFNVSRWTSVAEDLKTVPGLEIVPVLGTGLFCDDFVDTVLDLLATTGSMAAPGFMSPEGIIVWHHAARQMFKVTLENDEVPKIQRVKP